MSYYQQQNRRRLTIGEDGNTLVTLIAINLVVFVILSFIKVVYYFSYNATGLEMYNRQILDWVSLSANLHTFIGKPWTLLTHMFVHDGVWHLIANMLWLWAFGFILQNLTGNRKLIPIFIYGALAGAVAFMLSYNLIPAIRDMASDKAIGASAGVMAIAIATTVIAPNYRVFPMINGGIPLWVITLLFAIIDLATIPYGNPGGHIAHLAGAGMGWAFVSFLRRGTDLSNWMNACFDWANDLFNPDKTKQAKVVKSQIFYKASVKPFNKKPNVTQQRVDDILDKINQCGYNSLTEDEKEVLRRASKEDI
ncbi:MAG: rhomboid family intramembrane serine protease [Chitinophagaceae bacterium]